MNATAVDYLGNRTAAQSDAMRRAVAFSLALHVVLASVAGVIWHQRVTDDVPRQTEVTITFTVESASSVSPEEASEVAQLPLPREEMAENASASVPVPDQTSLVESKVLNNVAETAVESKPAADVPRAETRPIGSAPPATETIAGAATDSKAVAGPGPRKVDGEGESKPGRLAQPLYRRNPEPPYPLAARRRRQEGVVELVVEVSAIGRASRVTVQRTSGFKLLDEAAARAVKDWEFEPARVSGVAVESRIEVPVRFRLTE